MIKVSMNIQTDSHEMNIELEGAKEIETAHNEKEVVLKMIERVYQAVKASHEL